MIVHVDHNAETLRHLLWETIISEQYVSSVSTMSMEQCTSPQCIIQCGPVWVPSPDYLLLSSIKHPGQPVRATRPHGELGGRI